jgi:hypothetical protein
MLLVDAALRHVAGKYLESLLAPAAADNLTTPGASTSIQPACRRSVGENASTRHSPPAAALGYAHLRANWSGRGNGISLSAPGGGEGRGEVGDSRAPAVPTSPSYRFAVGPSLSPLKPEGRRGIRRRERVK